MRQTNLQFSKKDRVFKESCELSGAEPTKRQASKFRMGKGKAAAFAKLALTKSNQFIIDNTKFD